MTDIAARLVRVQARCVAATKGPWHEDENDPSPLASIVSTAADRPWGWVEVAKSVGADAEFIAASRTDLPALLTAVQAVVGLASKWDHHTDAGEDEHACTCHGCQVRQVITDALGGAA